MKKPLKTGLGSCTQQLRNNNTSSLNKPNTTITATAVANMNGKNIFWALKIRIMQTNTFNARLIPVRLHIVNVSDKKLSNYEWNQYLNVEAKSFIIKEIKSNAEHYDYI